MATIMVPDESGEKPIHVGALPDSGSGVSCVSVMLARKLEAYLKRQEMIYLMRRKAKAQVADRRELSVERQTCMAGVTI